MRLSARGKTARHFKRRSPILRSPGKIDFRRAPGCFPVSPTSIKRGTPKPGRTVSFLLPTTRCTNTSARETYMSRWTLRACRAFVAPPLAAVAKARAEIAARGLVVTVVQDYYAVAAAQQKLLSAQKTADEGDRFFKLTQDLEHGGEVAHSDVIKAELQAQDRRRPCKKPNWHCSMHGSICPC